MDEYRAMLTGAPLGISNSVAKAVRQPRGGWPVLLIKELIADNYNYCEFAVKCLEIC